MPSLLFRWNSIHMPVALSSSSQLTFFPFRRLVDETHYQLSLPCLVALHHSFFLNLLSFLTSFIGRQRALRPWLSIAGSNTFIFLGPLDPSTFVSYITTPNCLRILWEATFFLGFSPASNTWNSVPRKFDLSFPSVPCCFFLSFLVSVVIR